jgi:pSer/pThr/pTyr-binding forkhead associated (FHA) protein
MTTLKTVDSPIERLGVDTIPQLTAIYGPLSGHTFYLDEPVVSIGRLVSNNIFLEDRFLSRHHCVIRNEGDEYLIDDLNSANGTYVNGQPVSAASLKEGSLIEIGASRFLFRLPENRRAGALGHRSLLSDQDLVVAPNGRSSVNETGLG